MAYIYKITNILNNKIYIGQTIRQPSLRWNEHKSESLCSTSKHGRLYHLHCAIRKYGVDSFIFEVIDLIALLLVQHVVQIQKPIDHPSR